ncbi:MAG: Polyprenyltransferase [Promethearchaeota archaeon]|nr:MAG: Polyprenyltransferase [Candidatus Lokiarchaeota archaeon]
MLMDLKQKLKGYVDLTRAHFAPVWPLLFLTGLMLAFKDYNYFSWSLLIRVALIGLFGFEAGMVLNDIVDHDLDKLDTNDMKSTNYWRPFKERPIPSGIISLKEAIGVYLLFLIITILLIATLPFPNSIILYGFLAYGHGMEAFYQIKKRDQKYPIAQMLGRTDLTFFPIAGYLCYGFLDPTLILYILFLYPFALAHLGVNDLVDIENDDAKDLKTITVLYGIKGNIQWNLAFTLIHLVTASVFFIFEVGFPGIIGFFIASILLLAANFLMLREKTAEMGIKVLPMYHATLLVYILAILIDSFIAL